MKNTKLRLLLLTANMERGEISDYIVDIARYLQSNGIAPIVMSAGGYEVNRLRRYGITHIQAPLHSTNIFSLFKSYSKIKETIKEYKISLLHVHTPITGWLASYIRKQIKIPYISTIHYPYPKIGLKKLSGISKLKLKGLLGAEHVFTSFKYILNGLKEDTELKENITHLPRWVDTDFYSTENIASERLIALTQKWNVPDGIPLILNISEETEANDLTFLKAIASLPHKNFGVLMIRNWANMSNPLFKKLKKEAEELGVYKNISVIIPEDDEPLMYKIGDLIICTTNVSFARIALQSQSMGKITILPAVNGASNIIETGVNGKLYIQNSVQSLKDSLLWGLNLSQEKRDKISISARDSAKKLDKNTILPAFLRICNSLI